MSTCKECGAPVKWVHVRRRWQCLNPDGSDHWDRCSQLRFERIKREGKYFETDSGDKGYITALKKSGVQLVQQSSGVIASSRGAVSACRNCVPPWEVCETCPNALR